MAALVITDNDHLTTLVGTLLGQSEYRHVTQDMVNTFAEATGDHQWIHTDPERAVKESPFGGPIAHGYLTLSFGPAMFAEIVDLSAFSMGVNYGTEKVRFPAPVPIGSDVRLAVMLTSVNDIAGGVQMVCSFVFECRDAPKPCCVADVVYRLYN